MRQDLGATYSVGVRQAPARAPREEFSFTIDFGSAPERVDELVQTAFREIRQIQDSGATAFEVGKVREIQRRVRETSLRQNSYWIGQLEGVYREGIDPKDIVTYE